MTCKTNKNKRNNSILLPRDIRSIIVGKSGCCKTTLMFNLLLKPGWLDNNYLQVFGKSLFQPEYKILRSAFQRKLPKEVIIKLIDLYEEIQESNTNLESIIEDISESYKNKTDIECKFFETDDDVQDPEDLDISKKNLMIFDDFLLTN